MSGLDIFGGTASAIALLKTCTKIYKHLETAREANQHQNRFRESIRQFIAVLGFMNNGPATHSFLRLGSPQRYAELSVVSVERCKWVWGKAALIFSRRKMSTSLSRMSGAAKAQPNRLSNSLQANHFCVQSARAQIEQMTDLASFEAFCKAVSNSTTLNWVISWTAWPTFVPPKLTHGKLSMRCISPISVRQSAKKGTKSLIGLPPRTICLVNLMF